MTLDPHALEAAREALCATPMTATPAEEAERVVTAYLNALASRPSAIVEEPMALDAETRKTLIETAEGLEMSATAEQFVFDGLQPMVDRFHAGDHAPEVMRSLRVYNDSRHNKDWWRKQAAAIRAALNAALTVEPEAGEVTVKDLVWEQNWPNTPNSLWALVDPINRCYTIDPESNVFAVTTRLMGVEADEEKLGLHPTLDAAKSQAQADYTARIRSAIAP